MSDQNVSYFFVLKDDDVYEIWLDKTASLYSSNPDAYYFKCKIRELWNRATQEFKIVLSEKFVREKKLLRVPANIISSRLVYNNIGTDNTELRIGDKEVETVVSESHKSKEQIRKAILTYLRNKFRESPEVQTTVFEILTAVQFEPKEVLIALNNLRARKMFTTTIVIEDYNNIVHMTESNDVEKHLFAPVSISYWEIDQIEKKLESYKNSVVKENDEPSSTSSTANDKPIFIVHGRNEDIAIEIKTHIDSLGLNSIILKEQANKGLTIIEKLEENSNVGYAVVILSADDVGMLKSEKDLKPRARQNVILELGYFMGKIGRHKGASVLPQPIDFEKPSDIEGLVYIAFDGKQLWKNQINKELVAAGYKINDDLIEKYIDMNLRFQS